MLDTRLVRTSVDGDSHTLVLRRTGEEAGAFGLLFDLLPDDGPTNLLAVTHEQSQRFLHAWRERIDRRARNVGVVSVGEQMRSAASASVPQRTNRPVLRGVPDPEDLDDIRETTTQFLDAWGDDARTIVYFDSLSAIAERSDAGTAIEFLDDLLRAFDARGTAGYFCLRPAAHDRAVVREIASRFDTVLECVDSAADAADEPSVGDCFDAMSNVRRRWVLSEIADGEEVSVAELARSVAERTSADAERVQISLLNVHLPKLADLGLVAYDRDRGRVAVGHHFERAVPFLQKAADAGETRLVKRDE